MPSFEEIKPLYTKKFNEMVIEKELQLNWYIEKIKKNKLSYLEVEKQTGVPWYLVAIIHGKECEPPFNFDGCLHNGQPWNKKTTMVPRGRGPWKSWIDAACDAVTFDKLHLIDFDCPEKCLFAFEKYNGFGYWLRKKDNPYLFAGSNQYKTGMFVEYPFLPSVYIESKVNQGIGSAVILKRLVEIGEVVIGEEIVVTKPTPDALLPEIEKESFTLFETITNWIKALVRK